MRIVLNVVLVAGILMAPAALAVEEPKTAGEAYYSFDMGALSGAMLKEMDAGTLATVGDKVITKDYLESKIAEVPEKDKSLFEKSKPFLLAQLVQREILLKEARRRGLVKETDLPEGSAPDERSENEAIRDMIVRVMDSIGITDQEVEDAYEKHKDRIGNSDLEKVRTMLREVILQRKRQEAVIEFMGRISENITIAVNRAWAEEQDKVMADNPIDKARSSGKVTVVNFSSEWCAPCKEQEPILEEVRTERKDANVVTIDAGKEQLLALRFRVRATPTLIFFDAKGKEVGRYEGVLSKDQITKYLDEAAKAGE